MGGSVLALSGLGGAFGISIHALAVCYLPTPFRLSCSLPAAKHSRVKFIPPMFVP